MGTLAILILLSCCAIAQTQPSFEVAVIRPYGGAPRTNEYAPGIVNRIGVRLVDYIAWAYDVQDFEISGPTWMSDLRFDISAKAATPAPIPEMRRMMQALLAERFNLVLHREQREMGALVLTIGKDGHKLVENSTASAPQFSISAFNLAGDGATINQMTGSLTRNLHIRVVDQTGLAGRYNYRVDISSFVTDEMRRRSNGAPGMVNSTIMEMPGIVATAIQEQMGLRVTSTKIPSEVIIVDRIEKSPTEN